MSNEKADEFLSWRTKLTQPDALPDQGLDDPESTWQQIYARLVEQRPRRPFYWYGVAAACLLLALVPAALLLRDQPSFAKHSAKRTATHSAKRTATPPGNTARQGSIPPAPSVHPAISTPLITPNQPSTLPAIAIPPDGSWTVRTDPPFTQPDPHIPQTDRSALRKNRPALRKFRPIPIEHPVPPSIAGTPLSYPPHAPSGPAATTSPGLPPQLAQHPPVRRTRRVVSINELDDPAAPALTPTLARASTPFKVRLQTGKGFTRQASADREADPQFLQLKIPLQNP